MNYSNQKLYQFQNNTKIGQFKSALKYYIFFIKFNLLFLALLFFINVIPNIINITINNIKNFNKVFDFFTTFAAIRFLSYFIPLYYMLLFL